MPSALPESDWLGLLVVVLEEVVVATEAAASSQDQYGSSRVAAVANMAATRTNTHSVDAGPEVEVAFV